MENTENQSKKIRRRSSTKSFEHEEESQEKTGLSKKGSIYGDIGEEDTLYRPEFKLKETDKNEKIWSLMGTYLPRDVQSIEKSIVNHIEYTLARTRFDMSKQIIYQGVALSIRDRLLEAWNDTQSTYTVNDSKRVYYLSIEFLLGRLLQNALINTELDKTYGKAVQELGYSLEEVYDSENDPALGNGGLGRLAACFLDSLTTLNIPAWGYGIRYDYGIFRQVIENCQQKEYPDYWLTKGNPWEIQRLDRTYKVRFYGHVRTEVKNNRKNKVWEGGQEIIAMAYDTAIPGWNTFNVNTLRLWRSFPCEEFDFDSFNKGDHSSAMEDTNSASYITSVLYPNDSTNAGKELRLKQQYFFVCATIQDIVRRFLKSGLPWSDFPTKCSVQLNDTHPSVAIPELLRQLLDIYSLEFEEAMDIVRRTFSYTNHTVLPEALEKWGVDLFGNLLPRHLELIYYVNYLFMEKVKKKHSNNPNLMSKLSMIEEGNTKMIRMANLAIVGSHKVNGVAAVHSELIKTTLFKEFSDFFPGKFTNVTNGVTPRRWVHCAFPELSALLTKYSKNNDWLGELFLLETLPDDLTSQGQMDSFMDELDEAKLKAKERLAKWVLEKTDIEIDPTFLFDIQVKRIHEYKRQLMNALYCVHRYLEIKAMSASDRENVVKRVTFFGGKAAPGYVVAKNTIRMINMIASVVNSDSEVNKYFKMVYLPDYKVSAAQIIIPAANLSQHISTAGTEASGTSNMKFAMTGSLIIGTRDGANIEIAEEIGEENIFFFGKNVEEVVHTRDELKKGKKNYTGSKLKNVIDCILSGKFGDCNYLKDYLSNMLNGGDYYLVCHDFYAYLDSQNKVDEAYKDKKKWDTMCLNSIAKMGFFSSDRSIKDYADHIWDIKPVETAKPAKNQSARVISSSNLKSMDK